MPQFPAQVEPGHWLLTVQIANMFAPPLQSLQSWNTGRQVLDGHWVLVVHSAFTFGPPRQKRLGLHLSPFRGPAMQRGPPQVPATGPV